ncbi:SWIM zinc finger family protein [Streptomyces sp. NBC_01433]|uniref:SWIM zinc finger family protein n=1 Tax=Streptomyces sp. NBC_01433 TaxID=2903864 RepID=UPI0022556339|nr:SWIM zinc finger family protein [Streptomyces sp. NBC_01433]MCX4681584.1 SWIM zinc finger family protein [Streptomyces sp. NBC_01433]
MNRTPGNDRDRRRVFRPLPPARGRRSFADTWWGNAWVDALEGPSRSVTGRLARGRTYARAGNVREITITPGRVTAQVNGSLPTPYRTSMEIQQLTTPQWDALLDVAAGRAGHLAALLDHDMPTTLAEDAAQAGVQLLPSSREFVPSCSCPDDGYPCKHAAALYYQVARLLDQDPFVLLLLRGRGESELMAELHRRNAARAAATTMPAEAAPRGVSARQVFAAAQAGLPPLPAPPPVLHHSAPIAQWATVTEPVPGVDAEALEFLATDTAVRAVQLLRQALLPQSEPVAPTALSVADDAARLAAADPPLGISQRLAWGTRRTPTALARAARAWRYGGVAALAVLDEPWEADPLYLRAVREEIRRAWAGERVPRLGVDESWVTVLGHDAQLRLGRDGYLWYPYRKKHGAWWPAGFPQRDVGAVLSELVAPDLE